MFKVQLGTIIVVVNYCLIKQLESPDVKGRTLLWSASTAFVLHKSRQSVLRRLLPRKSNENAFFGGSAVMLRSELINLGKVRCDTFNHLGRTTFSQRFNPLKIPYISPVLTSKIPLRLSFEEYEEDDLAKDSDDEKILSGT